MYVARLDQPHKLIPHAYKDQDYDFCNLTAGKGCYGIRVVNGEMAEAGTSYSASEYVRLVGDKAASEKIYLTGIFSRIGSKTYIDLLVKTDESLGEIQVVNLGIEGGMGENAWFVQYSVVYNYDTAAGKESRFPCYHFLNEDESVSTTSTSGNLCEVAIVLTCNTEFLSFSHTEASWVKQDPFGREEKSAQKA